jgi:dienelactone hydrolase/pimeloyl-ACP methyl ester carboxylesterase
MLRLAFLVLAAQEDLTVLKAEDHPRKMLYAYLEGECAKKFEERRRTVAGLGTPEEVKRRQEELRSRFLAALGGLPERTPLQARITGTLKGDGFRVEKVIYESRPDHHVTGALYLPEGKGPFPGVLVPCGHSDKGKAEEAYQRISILLAKNGFVVLCFDPIGQGERMQLLTPEGRPAIKGNTTEHTMVEVAALPVGWCTASFRVWDGIRSLDYLASRAEVDPKRLGCTGNSGGGTMTAYLMALDDRIACAAPSCYLTTLERLFATIGPQDGEQNITGQVDFGMEQTDYVTMRAPRPTLICTATQDFFDIQGSWTTFRESKRLYGILGHAERVDLIEVPDKHGFSKPRREAAMRWMRRWLGGQDDAPVELDTPVFKEQELWCTPGGQVLSGLKGKSVFDLIAGREEELRKARVGRKAPGALAGEVTRLLALGGPPSPTEVPRHADPLLGPVVARTGYEIHKTPFRTASGTVLAALSLIPAGAADSGQVILLDGEGKAPDVAPGGPAEREVKEGRAVLALDLAGMGETAPEGRGDPFGPEWKEAFLALHLNRPLLGQRVRDTLEARRAWGDRPTHLVGRGAAAPVALHAALLDPSVGRVTLEGMLLSWSSVARSPKSRGQLASVVPGALGAYDLPDLAAALAPRPLSIRNPVDPLGRPVLRTERTELEAAYSGAREAYRAAGAEKNLVLEAAP